MEAVEAVVAVATVSLIPIVGGIVEVAAIAIEGLGMVTILKAATETGDLIVAMCVVHRAHALIPEIEGVISFHSL